MPRLLVLCLLLAAGCNASNAWTRSELYFGLSGPGGTEITDDQWQQFLSEVVTPQFPDGLVVVDGAGQYRGADGKLVLERSKILIILRPSTRSSDAKLDEIREEYCRRFGQESVLRVDAPARTEF